MKRNEKHPPVARQTKGLRPSGTKRLVSFLLAAAAVSAGGLLAGFFGASLREKTPDRLGPPHPDLKLQDAEFDLKYFPELVKRVEEATARHKEAVDLKWKYLKTDDYFVHWKEEADSRFKLLQVAEDSLSEARAKMREHLTSGRPARPEAEGP